MTDNTNREQIAVPLSEGEIAQWNRKAFENFGDTYRNDSGSGDRQQDADDAATLFRALYAHIDSLTRELAGLSLDYGNLAREHEREVCELTGELADTHKRAMAFELHASRAERELAALTVDYNADYSHLSREVANLTRELAEVRAIPLAWHEGRHDVMLGEEANPIRVPVLQERYDAVIRELAKERERTRVSIMKYENHAAYLPEDVGCAEYASALTRRADTAESINAELTKALEKYGRHDHFCPAYIEVVGGIANRCDCGFAAALSNREGERTP